jgi:hypothetical protein
MGVDSERMFVPVRNAVEETPEVLVFRWLGYRIRTTQSEMGACKVRYTLFSFRSFSVGCSVMAINDCTHGARSLRMYSASSPYAKSFKKEPEPYKEQESYNHPFNSPGLCASKYLHPDL